MNFKTTSILIVLLAVVIVIVMVTGKSGNSTSNTPAAAPTAEGPKVLDLKPGYVTRITIVNAAGEKTAIQNLADVWSLTSPIAAPAVDYKVQSLITALLDIHSRGVPSDVSDSDSGLDKPRYHITLDTADGKTTSLDIGVTTGVGDVMYARVNKGDVNLIDSSLEKTLKTAATDVRDMHLLTMKDTDVKQFRLTRDGQTIAARIVDGKWNITEPTTMPGDTGGISSFLQGAVGIEATSFLKSDDAEIPLAGFDKPTATLWMSDTAPTTQPASTEASSQPVPVEMTLTIGAADSLLKDHYFAQTSDGTISKIASASLEALKRTPLDLRDRDIVTVNPDDVTGINLILENYPAMATSQGSTQPTTIPGKFKPLLTRVANLLKRPPAPKILGPSLPTTVASSTTMPTSMASTLPTSMPTPDSQWRYAGDVKSQLDDSKVQAILGKLQPLRADSYHQAKLPLPSQVDTLDLLTTGGKIEIKFEKFSDGTGSVGIYNGLTFDVPNTLLDALEVDFQQAK